MREINIHKAVAFLSMLALTGFGWNGVGQVFAQQPIGDGHADHDHGDHDHSSHEHAAESGAVGPNGGQLTTAGDYQWEVVYSPSDIHLFAFDSRRQPVALQGVVGEMLMRVKGVEQEFKYPLGYAQMANAQGQPQDVLGNQVDVSRVRDGEMQVVFVVQGLPSQTTPSVRFEQTFALTRPVGTAAPQPASAPPMNQAQPLTVTVAAPCCRRSSGRRKAKDLSRHGHPARRPRQSHQANGWQ